MELKNCPKCNGPAKIMRDRAEGKLYNVWIECAQCGYRSGSMCEGPEDETPIGVKIAALLWNSTGDRKEEIKENGKNQTTGGSTAAMADQAAG